MDSKIRVKGFRRIQKFESRVLGRFRNSNQGFQADSKIRGGEGKFVVLLTSFWFETGLARIGADFTSRTRAGMYDGYWRSSVISPKGNIARDMGGKFYGFTCFSVGFGIRPSVQSSAR